ncbi:MAG: hypothetical protein U9P79_09140 [Candidatus Cloacimonadota bacterium]|nr:hypothetical protein [Candidatus Cloacimonadota bacterium]
MNMKKYLKKISPLLILVITLFLSTCDSPLSDEELDDPSLIAPDITLEKNINYETRSVIHIATAHLYDKNFNLVRIEDGGVRVGDTNLDLKQNILGGYYYETTDIAVNNDVTYHVVITMSNGDTYDAYVTTQSAELYEFVLPEEHDHGLDMDIQWAAASSDSMQIVWDYNTDEESGTGIIEIPSQFWQSGEYTIPASELSDLAGYDVNFTIQSIKLGQISESFRTGRIIRSVFSITQQSSIQ